MWQLQENRTHLDSSYRSHARKLNIAEVNCDEATGVEGYKAIWAGKDSGMHKTEFSGGRKFEQLRKFAGRLYLCKSLLLNHIICSNAWSCRDVETKNQDDYEHYITKSCPCCTSSFTEKGCASVCS